MQCSCAHGGVRGWLPCPFQNLSYDLNAAVMPAATPQKRAEQRTLEWNSLLSVRDQYLFLLAGDRLGRALAGARIGMGALTAHRQPAAMTQAAIAAEVHQTLDVHAGLAAQVALDHIVAVDDFTNLKHFLIAQLGDAAIIGNLDLLQ